MRSLLPIGAVAIVLAGAAAFADDAHYGAGGAMSGPGMMPGEGIMTGDGMMSGGGMMGMMNMMTQMGQMMATCNAMMQSAMQPPATPSPQPGQPPQNGG